jgi:hypothetical protein
VLLLKGIFNLKPMGERENEKEYNANSVSLKEYFQLKSDFSDFRVKALEEKHELQTKNTEQITELRWRLSENAINKSETAMLERAETSNNKYALLKEQHIEFQQIVSQLPKREEIGLQLKALEDKVSMLSKFVWIGIGGVIVLEILLKYILKT